MIIQVSCVLAMGFCFFLDWKTIMSNKTQPLSPKQEKVMILLTSKSFGFTSSVEIIHNGILNPSQTIYTLKKKGALFDTKLEDVTLANGITYKRVAHYRFRGIASCHIPF